MGTYCNYCGRKITGLSSPTSKYCSKGCRLKAIVRDKKKVGKWIGHIKVVNDQDLMKGGLR